MVCNTLQENYFETNLHLPPRAQPAAGQLRVAIVPMEPALGEFATWLQCPTAGWTVELKIPRPLAEKHAQPPHAVQPSPAAGLPTVLPLQSLFGRN